MASSPVCISFIIIALLTFIALKLYAFQKAKQLREVGYDFVYYYMKNCDSLAYYRVKKSHIGVCYYSSNEILKSNRNKWYLAVSSKSSIAKMISFFDEAEKLSDEIRPYLLLNHYFAYSECQRFMSMASVLETKMNSIVNNECQEFIYKKYSDAEFYIEYPKKKQYQHNLESLRQQHNKEFVDKELSDNKDFFDHVLKYPLDKQQRESIMKLEDNCLVISSAGSGKTSTSIAKVKYLLDKRHLSKEEILVISYNRKTAEEFQERLDVPGLTCKTFHALALSIIGQTEGKRPDICDDTFLLNCYYKLIRTNEEYKSAVTKFVTEVSSLTKGEHEYEESEEYYKDRETYGIMAPYGDMNGDPIYTRSEEEKKICTWLSSHGVRFQYEQPYPYITADTQHRQYKPDFTIFYTQNGQEKRIFLEHFGIDSQGNVPQWFGEGSGGFYAANQKYNSDIVWKRQIHRNNNTILLETTSAMFHNGTVYTQLEHQLRNIGVPTRELSEEEKYRLLFERDRTMEDNIMNLFTSFINLMKSNGKTFDTIMEDIKKDNQGDDFNERCRFLMYELIKPLYEEYERSLKDRGQMDFTDLVLHASELCSSGKWESPYSYILVDEFQDISVDRYKFILSLRKQSPLTKTFCVGDDWQSIYRFSGSDMNLFNHFENYFGFTERCKIETTYRFGNPLIQISSSFILKNPSQVQKVVKPYSEQAETKLSFYPFSRLNKDEYLNRIKEVLDSIPRNESVMLLARYNYEVKVFPQQNIEQRPNSKKAKVRFAGRAMDFMSVHASKGLEADHVLILNCSQDTGGFPSRVTDDPILGYVLSEIDTYEYSEERRLFYVAITRARKHTHVLYNENMPSIFVTEIMDKEGPGQMLCPHCKKGRLKMIKDSVSINGKRYRNYLCSNSVAGCHFFWQVYFDEESEIMRKYHAQMGSYFSSTRGRNIVPQPSGFPAPGSTPSVRISRRVIPPPDFRDDLPF